MSGDGNNDKKIKAYLTDIKEFKPDPDNANRHTLRGRSMVEKGMEQRGYARPAFAANDGTVLGGNLSTMEVAPGIGLGDGKVFVVESDGTIPIIHKRVDVDSGSSEARLLALEDNRTGEVSLDWNPLQLTAEIEAGLDLSGLWDDTELAAILEAAGTELLGGNGKEAPEPQDITETEAERLAAEYGVQPGQVWALGRHKIACIDSLDEAAVKALIGSDKVGMVWADPPYSINAVDEKTGQTGGLGRPGVGYPFGGAKNDGKNKPIPSNVYAPVIGDDTTQTAERSFGLCLSLFKKALQVWWGANNYSQELPPSTAWIVWDKQNDGNAFADAELAWTNHDGAVRIFRHLWNGMLKASEQGQRRIHPTQKPIALAHWCFEKYGKPGDVIFDPFLGSGISVLAAEQLDDGRRVIGCELAPAYIGAVLHRWHQATGNQPQLVSG